MSSDRPSERNPPHEPDERPDIDRTIRINELTEELRERGMGDMHVEEACTPDLQEQFLKSILEYENLPMSTLFEELERDGVLLPPPGSLDDASLHAKLWEIFHALAKRNTAFQHTDHLSDRDLYEHLWNDSFREEGPMMPPDSGWMGHIDILGSWGEEEVKISQRYYDSEEQRQRWLKDFPDDVLPAREKPPYDRDRHMPRPPEPSEMFHCEDGENDIEDAGNDVMEERKDLDKD